MNNAPRRWSAAIARSLGAIAGWSLTSARWLSAVAARLVTELVIRFPVLGRTGAAVARRFPAVGRMPHRHAVLGVASLAIIGGAIVGPIAARSGPAEANPASATSLLPFESDGRAPATAPAPAEALKALPPVVAPPPFEKALYPDFKLQPNYYYCGPAATRLAITAHGVASPNMDDLAWMLGTTTGGTNSAADTTRVLNRILGQGIYHTHEINGYAATAKQMDQLRENVVHAVSNGYAAVANVVGGAGDINGGWHQYDGGHYVSVVGYGQGGLTMKIADPADTVGDGTYWVSTQDLANWMATRGYSA